MTPMERTLAALLKGPSAMHFASGRISSRLDAASATGASVLGVSAEDDLGELKRRCAGKVALLGNLSGVKMVHWSAAEAASQTRRSLDAAAPGGGFILADNHGEIPFQVKDEVLHAIVQTTAAWAP